MDVRDWSILFSMGQDWEAIPDVDALGCLRSTAADLMHAATITGRLLCPPMHCLGDEFRTSDLPCDVSTSTWRSFATISSGL
jgi:hypothetical protein